MDLTLEIATCTLRTTRFNTKKRYVMCKECIHVLFIYTSVSQFFSHEISWLRKLTTVKHILSHVNIGCPGNGYPKLKMCISELI